MYEWNQQAELLRYFHISTTDRHQGMAYRWLTTLLRHIAIYTTYAYHSNVIHLTEKANILVDLKNVQ